MTFQLGQPPPYETWRIALTIASSVVALASMSVTAYVLFRTKTARYWKEEREAAVVRAERLEAENKVCKERVAVLEAQRDLTGVQEGQTGIVRAIDALAAHEAERHAALAAAVGQNTKVMLGFQSQMASVFDAYQQTATEQQKTAAEMVLLLRDINNNTQR